MGFPSEFSVGFRISPFAEILSRILASVLAMASESLVGVSELEAQGAAL